MTEGKMIFLAAEVIASDETPVVPLDPDTTIRLSPRVEYAITLRLIDGANVVHVLDFGGVHGRVQRKRSADGALGANGTDGR